MSLNLDARQRAMLEEMGVPVWSPKPVAVLVAPAAAATLATVNAPNAVPAHTTTHTASAPVSASITAPASAQLNWVLQPPQPLYPDAAIAAAPATPSTTSAPRWLLVAEGVTDGHPLAGDAGNLLDNMLYALGLRQQPQVFICLLTPVAAEASATTSATTASTYNQALSDAVAEVQPAILLLMGRAARTVLGRSEPLGQLRLLLHRVANLPAVVTYDAPYLLRAPAAKAATWYDLCRAKALAQQLPP